MAMIAVPTKLGLEMTCDARFPPPLWERVREGGDAIASSLVAPIPRPSPQRGGEPATDAARLCSSQGGLA
jgi:hypothetical protein